MIPIIALFVFGGLAALVLMRWAPPPLLVKGKLARFILCIVALALLSVVGLRDPLPVSAMFPVATGLLAVMLAGVVVGERRLERRG